MIQITNLQIIETEVDEDSGDMYYTVKAELFEPGAAFKTGGINIDRIRKQLENGINKTYNSVKDVIQ